MIAETLSPSKGLSRSRILIDYDRPDAIIQAIEAAAVDRQHLRLEPENIPLVGSGAVERDVHAVCFGRSVFNRDLPGALQRRGSKSFSKANLKMADPLATLYFAGTISKLHKLATLFYDSQGRLWSLYLYDHFGLRVLHVDRTSPESYWSGDVRFPAFCEPLAA